MKYISKWFSWKEALWLPQWDREANESDGLNDEIRNNLIKLFIKMDTLRQFFGKPINVHVSYRPEEYNKLVKGALNSSHKFGMAVDFHVKDIQCDIARQMILDNKLLESLSLRMEDLSGSNWIHIDIREPGPSGRYFRP